MSVPINQSFWQFGNWSGSGLDNPWINGGQNAPFDQEFYLIINLAVGGTNGYFPDNLGNKPWSDSTLGLMPVMGFGMDVISGNQLGLVKVLP